MNLPRVTLATLFLTCSLSCAEPENSSKELNSGSSRLSTHLTPNSAAPSPMTETAPGIDPGKFKDPVAKVNGRSISRREFETAAQNMLAALGGTTGAGKLASIPANERNSFYKMVLQQLINEKLIGEKAVTQEVTEEEVTEELNRIRSQFPDEKSYAEQLAAAGKKPELLGIEISNRKRQQKYLEAELQGKSNVTDEEVRKYFDENPSAFSAPETLRASHIQILLPKDAGKEMIEQKMKTAQAIAKRVKKDPLNFEQVARAESEAPNVKETGGDVGYFTREGFPYPEFYESVNQLAIGEVSDPLQTPEGFYVVRLTEKKAARNVTFEEAKKRLVEYLGQQKKQEHYDKLIESLRKDAKIEILEEAVASQ